MDLSKQNRQRLRMPVRVELEDGHEFETVVRLVDFVAVERHFKQPISAMERDPYLEWIMYGAHHALRREGQIDRDLAFDTFLALIEEFNVGELVEVDADGETPAPAPEGSDVGRVVAAAGVSR